MSCFWQSCFSMPENGVAPWNLRAAAVHPMQPASCPAASLRLHSQLPAHSKGHNATFRCTCTNLGLGHGPKLIPGVPWFQSFLLVVPQKGESARGCHVLMVPFSKAQHCWELWTSRPGCLPLYGHHGDHDSIHACSCARLPWGHPIPQGMGPLI